VLHQVGVSFDLVHLLILLCELFVNAQMWITLSMCLLVRLPVTITDFERKLMNALELLYDGHWAPNSCMPNVFEVCNCRT